MVSAFPYCFISFSNHLSNADYYCCYHFTGTKIEAERAGNFAQESTASKGGVSRTHHSIKKCLCPSFTCMVTFSWDKQDGPH